MIFNRINAPSIFDQGSHVIFLQFLLFKMLINLKHMSISQPNRGYYLSRNGKMFGGTLIVLKVDVLTKFKYQTCYSVSDIYNGSTLPNP